MSIHLLGSLSPPKSHANVSLSIVHAFSTISMSLVEGKFLSPIMEGRAEFIFLI